MQANGVQTTQVMPGKAAQSVGHMAKAAVKAAQEGGAVLPSNAQGMAASALARGAEPSSIFAAMVVPETPPDDGVTPAGPDAPEGSVATAPDGSEAALGARYADAQMALSGSEAAIDILINGG